MKKFIFILFFTNLLFGQNISNSENYILEINYLKKYKDYQLNTVLNSNKIQNLTYFNGLGQIKQNILIGQSTNNQDFIKHFEYDEFGRNHKSFLPYPSNVNIGSYRSNAKDETNFYYNNKFNQNVFYSEKKYSDENFNLVTEQGAPGDDWGLINQNTTYTYQNQTTKSSVYYFNNSSYFEKNSSYNRWAIIDDVLYIDMKISYSQPNSIRENSPNLNQFTNFFNLSIQGTHNLGYVKDENWNDTPYRLKFQNGNFVLENTSSTFLTGEVFYISVTFPLTNISEIASPNTIKFDYSLNSVEDNVRFYSVSYTNNNKLSPQLILNGSYTINELTKNITKDENWKPSNGKNNTTEEFKDKQGRVILIRTYSDMQINGAGPTQVPHDTYYVYDDYGNLTYVLPPKAEPQSAKPDTTEMLELCYQYKYDERNRLVEKKIPGKGWEYSVYNKLDQPIMTQDQNLKAQNKWLFTKYDKFGRIAYTGFSNTGLSRSSLQTTVNGIFSQWVIKVGAINLGGAVSYYDNGAYPNTVSEILTFNYYDDYTFDKNGLVIPSSSYGVSIVNYNNASSTRILTKGLATGSKVKVLGQNGHWVTTISGYDDKGRVIWVGTYNSFLGTTDITENKLDFIGNILATKTTHKKTGKADIVTIDTFKYDHAQRLVSQQQQINGQDAELIFSNEYDELGQLIKKNVGGISSSIIENLGSTTYTDIVGATVSGTEVTSTAATGWNNSGFATVESFSNEGYVEYVIPQTGKYLMAGLSTDNPNAHYNTIDYAIYHYSTNRIYVYESGSNRGQKTTYSIGDIFRVERVGSTVYYKKNGITFYTSTVDSTGNLLGDVAFYQNAGKVKDFKTVSGIEPIYKDIVGATVSGPEVTSTATTGWNNSGFATVENFSNDGYVEYEMPQTNKYVMLGLSPTNINAHYNTIKYAIYNRSNGTIYIYESGSYKGSFGTYQIGDIFRIERVGSTVYYKKNGTTFYTSTVASTGNLIGDVAFYHNAGKVKNFIIVDYDYIDLVGVELTNGVAKKIADDNWGTGGFASKEKISSNGYVELEVLMLSTYSMFGLSPTNVDAHYNTIKYAIYLNHPSSFYVYEMGTNKGLFGTYRVGDVFRVERVGSSIYYKKNGQTFYTSTVNSTGSLLGDVSIKNTARLVKIDMVNTESEALQTIDYTYNIRGWLTKINDVGNLSDDLFSLGISYNNRKDDIYNQVDRLYNGNISETYWRTATDNYTRGYGYGYDAMNRIKDAFYTEPNNLEFLNTNDRIKKYPGFHDLRLIRYDKNGNIDYFKRHGRNASNQWNVMDRLYYTYETKSNKLAKIVEGTDATDEGFKDGTNTSDDYSYDANGNLTADYNKGIMPYIGKGYYVPGIAYNHLNLPTAISFGNFGNDGKIEYIYDANGNKLQKKITTKGFYGDTENYTIYSGNYIYTKTIVPIGFPGGGSGSSTEELQFFNHSEGYITPNNNGSFDYVYQYKDHLGNVRLSYSDSNKDGHITDAAIFSDGFENSSGWDSEGALHGSSATMDGEHIVSGTTAAKLTLSGAGDLYAHSNKWISIDNNAATDYIISGWVYLESPSSAYARVSFFMNEDGETAYFTLVANGEKIRTKNQWLYVEQTVTVPINIDKINARIEVYTSYSSGASAWFDDIQIKKAGSTEIVEESNYYPFGLKHKGYNNVTSSLGNGFGQLYQTFQGREFTNNLNLNIHEWKYRISDPAIGRFWQIDPLADDYAYNSAYSFAENKLGLGTELEGAEINFLPWLLTESAKNPNGVAAHTLGVNIGLYKSAKGTWDFITSDAWKSKTWKGLGNLGLGILGAGPYGNLGNLIAQDAALGTNSFEAYVGLNQAVANSIDKVKSGNGIERGEVFGEIVGAVFGTKGVNLAFKGVTIPTKIATASRGLSDLQLVQKAANFADNFIPFTKNAGITGTLKHSAANRFLHLYQLRNGNRGLRTNRYFNNGVNDRGFLDIINENTLQIWDFKFGQSLWRPGQFEKYTRNFDNFTIEIVSPIKP